MSTDANAVTDEQIAAIADRLVEEGRQVSPVTIWSEVPGSALVAVAAALDRWREARQPRLAPMQVQTALPEELAQTIVSAATRVWSAAQDDMQRSATQRLDVLNQHLANALAERSEALAGFQKALEEVEADRARLAALSDALSASEHAAARLSTELATAAGSAQAAEVRVHELLQRAAEDDARHAAANSAHEDERAALAAAVSSRDDEIARITRECDEARNEAASLSEACQVKSEEARRWSEASGVASSRAEAAIAQAAARETELEETRSALAAERQTSAVRMEEASTHLNELQRVAQELEAARHQLATMANEKTAASAEAAQAAQQVSALKTRAEAAEQQVSGLEQRLAQFNAVRDDERQRSEAARADDNAAWQRQIAAEAKAHEKAYNELHALAQQWVEHAKDLKQRLSAANERTLFIDARSTGEVALIRRLSAELERMKPDHELISRDAQQKLISATMTERLAQKGYQYDPSTAVISKKAS